MEFVINCLGFTYMVSAWLCLYETACAAWNYGLGVHQDGEWGLGFTVYVGLQGLGFNYMGCCYGRAGEQVCGYKQLFVAACPA